MSRETRTGLLGILGCLALAGCGETTTSEAPGQQDVEAARAAAAMLGKTLKGRLMTAMEEGGPAAAIAVCAEEAPEIARSVSEETGYTVARTALRIRNPHNQPDDWEEAQLLLFTQAVAEGAEVATLETYAVVEEGDERRFRWAKPILLEGPCAMCHGQNVSPEIKSLIAEYYPEDQATGFAPGEVRGIFTVEKRLP